MRYRTLYAVVFMAALFHGIVAEAQYSIEGDDPASARWFQTDTPHYKIIYPEGLDSLSRVYGLELEKYRLVLGLSTGYVPGDLYKRKTPVVLHPFNSSANGFVAWAPKRMGLYTVPEAYGSLSPTSWPLSVTIHEQRHVSQMALGYDGVFRPLSHVFGDVVSSVLSGYYTSSFLHEGDAVVAETALTSTGRGRMASFLSYYRASFAEGDMRDWYRWRYGSFRKYTPNEYALGYMTIAGVRVLYDDPLFMQRYFSMVSRRPIRFFNLQRNIKLASGKKLRQAMPELFEEYRNIWAEDDFKRGPLTPAVPISTAPKFYTAYSGNTLAGGELYSIKSSYVRPAALVKISSGGEEKRLKSFSSNTSKLVSSGSRLWWSENIPDLRWSLKSYSNIRYMDLSTGRVRSLTSKTRYFNPAPSEDEKIIVVAEYPVEGGSALVMLDAVSGGLLQRVKAPDSLQVVEPVWIGRDLYFTGISPKGTGVYKLEEGRVSVVLSPQPISVKEPQSRDGRLQFISDRTGVDELYSLDPTSGELLQHSVTVAESGGWAFSDADQKAYFSSLSSSGMLINETSISNLRQDEVSFADITSHKIADKITEQEKALAQAAGIQWAEDSDFETEFSRPKRWRKLTHIPHFHNWLPFYYDTDEIADVSVDDVLDELGFGATAAFQNLLETAYGSVAYRWAQDTDGSGYRSSAHLDFTYSGLYPVFNLQVDFGERNSAQYYRRSYVYGSTATATSTYGYYTDNPYLYAKLKVYIPFDFSSSGWSRGFIPTVSYTFTNDRLSKSYVEQSYDTDAGEFTSVATFTDYEEGPNTFLHNLDFSIRGYSIQSQPISLRYPRFGIGAEAGYHMRLNLDDFYTASAYFYAYGYLPGPFLTHSMKLTALYQHQFEGGSTTIGENAVVVRPRGYSGSNATRWLGLYAPNQAKFTLDYAVPFSIGDVSCFAPWLYIKNFVLIPHCDFTQAWLNYGLGQGNLVSAGSALEANLGTCFFIPFECTVGVSYSYNCGNLYNYLSADRHYVEFTLEVDI